MFEVVLFIFVARNVLYYCKKKTHIYNWGMINSRTIEVVKMNNLVIFVRYIIDVKQPICRNLNNFL